MCTFIFKVLCLLVHFIMFRETFQSTRNQEVLQQLVKDSKVQLPDTTSAIVKGKHASVQSVATIS